MKNYFSIFINKNTACKRLLFTPPPAVRDLRLGGWGGRFFFFFFFLSVLSSCATSAQVQRKKDVYDLYLLIGQSNMAGRGPLTEEFKTKGNDNVFMLNKNGEWVKAKNPLHFDKPSVAGVGPGLSFGMAMAKKAHHHKIGLIPCAVGGTSINVWEMGGYDKATKTYPYDDAISRLKTALLSGKLKGIIWLQGESDSSPEKSVGYLDKLKALIYNVRNIAQDSTVPFVAGELGRYNPQYDNINKQLKELPSTVKYTAVATSEGLTDKGDNTHFNSESQEEYGKRFAKKMKRLQRQEH